MKLRWLPLLLCALQALGCGSRRQESAETNSIPPRETQPAQTSNSPASIASEKPQDLFTDITEEAGIHFVHFNDASSHRYLPETMGSGAAFFDYDGDGRPDLYIVNGAPLIGDRSHARSGTLYRNLDGKHFQDVTHAAGLDAPLFGMGVAVGDFDNHGYLDLFISGVGGGRLYRNRSDGTFEDVTKQTGLTDAGFGSSAAFVDHGRDGYLDLFVGRYVQWTPGTDIPCSLDGAHRIYCTPEVYKGQTNRLWG